MGVRYMKVIIDLSDEILKIVEHTANDNKRSRKKQLELIIERGIQNYESPNL